MRTPEIILYRIACINLVGIFIFVIIHSYFTKNILESRPVLLSCHEQLPLSKLYICESQSEK